MVRLTLAVELDQFTVFRSDLFQMQVVGEGSRVLGRGNGCLKVARLGLCGGKGADEQWLAVPG
jgi:hypothetical protein